MVKEILSNNSIMAGLLLELLRNGTRRSASPQPRNGRRTAPGGRFIFCTGDKVLLSGPTRSREHPRVNEFVHGYGLYY